MAKDSRQRVIHQENFKIRDQKTNRTSQWNQELVFEKEHTTDKPLLGVIQKKKKAGGGGWIWDFPGVLVVPRWEFDPGRGAKILLPKIKT